MWENRLFESLLGAHGELLFKHENWTQTGRLIQVKQRQRDKETQRGIPAILAGGGVETVVGVGLEAAAATGVEVPTTAAAAGCTSNTCSCGI